MKKFLLVVAIIVVAMAACSHNTEVTVTITEQGEQQ